MPPSAHAATSLPSAAAALRRWLDEQRPSTLHVAGPRHSECPAHRRSGAGDPPPRAGFTSVELTPARCARLRSIASAAAG